MSKIVSKRYVLLKHFDGEPKDEDFEVVEEELSGELNEDGTWYLFRWLIETL